MALSVNGRAVELLAKVASLTNTLLVHYSTDYLFDGEKKNFFYYIKTRRYLYKTERFVTRLTS